MAAGHSHQGKETNSYAESSCARRMNRTSVTYCKLSVACQETLQQRIHNCTPRSSQSLSRCCHLEHPPGRGTGHIGEHSWTACQRPAREHGRQPPRSGGEPVGGQTAADDRRYAHFAARRCSGNSTAPGVLDVEEYASTCWLSAGNEHGDHRHPEPNTWS